MNTEHSPIRAILNRRVLSFAFIFSPLLYFPLKMILPSFFPIRQGDYYYPSDTTIPLITASVRLFVIDVTLDPHEIVDQVAETSITHPSLLAPACRGVARYSEDGTPEH
jgi:hypothetical protein